MRRWNQVESLPARLFFEAGHASSSFVHLHSLFLLLSFVLAIRYAGTRFQDGGRSGHKLTTSGERDREEEEELRRRVTECRWCGNTTLQNKRRTVLDLAPFLYRRQTRGGRQRGRRRGGRGGRRRGRFPRGFASESVLPESVQFGFQFARILGRFHLEGESVPGLVFSCSECLAPVKRRDGPVWCRPCESRIGVDRSTFRTTLGLRSAAWRTRAGRRLRIAKSEMRLGERTERADSEGGWAYRG